MKTGKRRRRRRRAAEPLPAGLEHVNLHAAGIDIGAEVHYVAVPADRDAPAVRQFASFSADLQRLADWLVACEVTTVAMEATGVYWVPLYEVLEARGLKVVLVNARHFRNVPGRKSDVLDCQWLQQLHTFGLLRGSFRPAADIVTLRTYLRHRETLVQVSAEHIQHMQQALTVMNLQLHHVLSDITGETGMRILRAIVGGEQDPTVLTQFRDPRCHASSEKIAAALTGTYRADYLFVLQQALELYDVYQAKIQACDRQIAQTLEQLTPKVDPTQQPPPAPRKLQAPRGPSDAHQRARPAVRGHGSGPHPDQRDRLACRAGRGQRDWARHDGLSHRGRFHVLDVRVARQQDHRRQAAERADPHRGQPRRDVVAHGGQQSAAQ